MNDRADNPAGPAIDGTRLHFGIAEQGKVFSLSGDHRRALHYYRTAIRMTVEADDPEVMFRHYLDCVMESLEQMGAHAEVLAYCDRAIELYGERPPPNPLAVRDLAAIHQRRGVNLFLDGEPEAATAAFGDALQVARDGGFTLPLAETMRGWLAAGMHVEPRRLRQEQRRCGYFVVREDSVDPARVVRLPDDPGPSPGATGGQ